MALIPRVKVATDVDAPDVAAVLSVLTAFSERFNAGPSFDMRSTDAHAVEQLTDVMIAHLRRTPLSVPAVVKRHNCPHVSGLEEPSWTACTHPQYGYSETMI